jgi:3-hydroxyacyl-CoA dehydrogenase/enoyl-CoA hydratase/3-hydroxybutyryl-CoA epimerase
MMFNVKVEDDGVAVMQIGDITPESVGPLHAALAEIVSDNSVKGVVVDCITGLGTFRPDLARLDEVEGLRSTLRKLETSGKPAVAAISGSAVGTVFEITLACHVRIASDSSFIRLGLPGAAAGMLPGFGATQRLPRMIGVKEAARILLEGKLLDAEKARALGLISELVSADKLVDHARQRVLDPSAIKVQPWDQKAFAMPGIAVHSPAGRRFFSETAAAIRANPSAGQIAAHTALNCLYRGLQRPIDSGLALEAEEFSDWSQPSTVA